MKILLFILFFRSISGTIKRWGKSKQTEFMMMNEIKKSSDKNSVQKLKLWSVDHFQKIRHYHFKFIVMKTEIKLCLRSIWAKLKRTES